MMSAQRTVYYAVCDDCQETIDLWKYTSVEDAGHKNHKIRPANHGEFCQALWDCFECGCLREEFVGRDIERKQEHLNEVFETLKRKGGLPP